MDYKQYVETVKSMGRKAAECRYVRDQSGVNWQNDQAERIYRMFGVSEQYQLRKAFDEGYKEVSSAWDMNCRPN